MRDYIEKLRADGDLISIQREVDPRFELAAVTRAAQRAGESALRFERVRGTRIPVVTNVYGSRRRLASLIGAEPSGFCKRFVELTAATPGSDCAIEVAAPDDLVDGRLSDLPQITYYERDAGPYLTSAPIDSMTLMMS